MKHIAIFFVRLYQKYLSPLKPPCCRFTPTCSQYAVEAFLEWGFVIGLILSIWRVLRCNPFCKGGADPVPQNRRKRERIARRKARKEARELKKMSERD